MAGVSCADHADGNGIHAVPVGVPPALMLFEEKAGFFGLRL